MIAVSESACSQLFLQQFDFLLFLSETASDQFLHEPMSQVPRGLEIFLLAAVVAIDDLIKPPNQQGIGHCKRVVLAAQDIEHGWHHFLVLNQRLHHHFYHCVESGIFGIELLIFFLSHLDLLIRGLHDIRQNESFFKERFKHYLVVSGPSSHLGELPVQRVLKLLELGGQLAVDVFDLSVEVQPEDEVYVFIKVQGYFGMGSLDPRDLSNQFLNKHDLRQILPDLCWSLLRWHLDDPVLFLLHYFFPDDLMDLGILDEPSKLCEVLLDHGNPLRCTRLQGLDLVQLCQEIRKASLQFFSQLFVLLSLDADIDVHVDIELISFNDLVDVLEHLYDLRHHDYLLHDLLQHHGDLDDPVLGDDDWIPLSLHDFSHCFQGFFDEADLRLQDLLLFFDEFLLHFQVDCLHCGIGLFGSGDVALMQFLNHLYLLQQVGHLYQSLHDALDVLVDIDDLGHYPLHDFNGRRREDHLRLFLVFVDLGDLLDGWHQLLDIVRNLLDLVNRSVYCHDFLLEPLDFLNVLLDVRPGDLFELVSLLHGHSLLNLRDDLRLLLDNQLLHDLFDHLRNWLYLHSLSIDIHWHSPFYLNRHWHLHRLVNDSINELHLPLLYRHSDDLINVHGHRHLMLLYHHSLLHYLLDLDIGAGLKVAHHDLITRNFDCPIGVDVDQFFDLYLHWPFDVEILRDVVLHRWHLYGDLHDLFDDFLNDLGYFDDPLYDPGHNNDLLHDFLDLHALRHLHDLFDDLLFNSWHFLDLLEVYLLRDDLLLLHQHWHFLTHDKRHVLYHLHRLLLGEDHVLYELDWDVFLELNGLDEGHLMDLSFYLSLGDKNGHLNILLHLSDLHSGLIDNPRHLHLNHLNFFHHLQYLPHHLYLPRRKLHYPLNGYNLLDNLLDGLDAFLVVIYRHDLLYDFFDDLYPSLNMRHDLRHLLVAHHLNDLLDDLRHHHYLLLLYYLFNDLLNDHLDRLQHFFLGFNIPHYFLQHLNYLQLLLHHDLLHLDHHWLLDLHNLLHQHLLRLQFGFLPHFDGHALLQLRVRDYLLGVGHQLDWLLAVEGNWLVGLHYQGFFVDCHEGLLQRHGFCLQLIGGELLGYSDDIIDDSFHDLGHLNYLRVGPVHLEDILHIYQIHNLCADHADDALIDLKHHALLAPHLLHLLQQRLDENPQVELGLSGLFGAVGIDVLYLHHLRHVTYDIHNPIKRVRFYDLRHFQSEELHQLSVHFSLQLRVLFVDFPDMYDQRVNEVFGPRVLHGHFLGDLHLLLDLDHAVDVDHLRIRCPQGVEDEGVGADANVGVLALQFIDLLAVEFSSHVELVNHRAELLVLLDPHLSLGQLHPQLALVGQTQDPALHSQLQLLQGRLLALNPRQLSLELGDVALDGVVDRPSFLLQLYELQDLPHFLRVCKIRSPADLVNSVGFDIQLSPQLLYLRIPLIYNLTQPLYLKLQGNDPLLRYFQPLLVIHDPPFFIQQRIFLLIDDLGIIQRSLSA